MKKQKLPKYVQAIFQKPQFKIGDRVKFEFLGDHGWGYVTKINKYNDKITYMVQGNGYSYPCGIQIKEYNSYYAGSIFFEESIAYRKNLKNTGRKENESRNNSTNRKQISDVDGRTISGGSDGSSKKYDNRNGYSENSTSITGSRTRVKNAELETAISKQKDFLRKFT